MTPDAAAVAAIAAGLRDRQRRDLRNATTRDGETYVPAYSVMPRGFVTHQVWGRGDVLSPLGLAVRAHIMDQEGMGDE